MSLYSWRGDAYQIENYPYVKDDTDIAAFNRYASSGFLPPQRPNGFLDEFEHASWLRWRDRIENEGLK